MVKVKIYIDENIYRAEPDSELLGYMGETNARTIDFDQPIVEGADTYRLRLQYSDGAIYDVPIIDNKIIVTASLLREVGEIECQWIATKSNGDTYDLVAKSQVFGLIIDSSISDDVAPIPSYEQTKAISDKVLSAVENVQSAVDKINSIDLDNLGYDDSEIRQQLSDLAKEVGDNYRDLSAEIAKVNSNLIGNVNGLNKRIDTKADQSDVDELLELVGTLNTQLETRLAGGVDNE